MFPVYGGKCLSLKTVHNWAEKFSQGCSKIADDARAGFDALVKRWDKCISVGGGYFENFFPSHTFRTVLAL
jgi:hypothetical protein